MMHVTALLLSSRQIFHGRAVLFLMYNSFLLPTVCDATRQPCSRHDASRCAFLPETHVHVHLRWNYPRGSRDAFEMVHERDERTRGRPRESEKCRTPSEPKIGAAKREPMLCVVSSFFM